MFIHVFMHFDVYSCVNWLTITQWVCISQMKETLKPLELLGYSVLYLYYAEKLIFRNSCLVPASCIACSRREAESLAITALQRFCFVLTYAGSFCTQISTMYTVCIIMQAGA